MAEDRKLAEPILDEALFIKYIEEKNRQQIMDIIRKLPFENGREKRVKLRGGASVLLGSHDTILDIMVKCSYLNALRKCVEKYKINARDEDERALLHIAAQHGNKAAVELLLGMGADHFALNHDGCTPLHLAARAGHAHLIEPLVQSSKISSPNEIKKSAAGRKGHKSYKDFLRASDNYCFQTALGSAVTGSYREAMKQLEQCYSRLRPLPNAPFDEAVGKEAVKQFFAGLPGTKAQAYFNTVEKLFQVGDRDPSKSSFWYRSVFDCVSATSFGSEVHLFPNTRKELHSFFINFFLEPHIMGLFRQSHYGTALWAGLHPRAGAKSILQQLSQRDTHFDPQVLRLPLKLAGATIPKKASAFFAATNAIIASNASLVSSAPTERTTWRAATTTSSNASSRKQPERGQQGIELSDMRI